VALFKLGFACFVLWGAVGGFYYLLSLRYDLREIRTMPQRTVVLDCNDRFYSMLSGENRILIPFDKVSNDFINALLAREDTRFYYHKGVDPVGIARAAVRNLLMGGIRQGGSTITQQLARNSFPLGGRNFHRKLLEAALSFRIETELSKEEILECYINRIYFGSGCYGLETASRTYFDKPASRLTLAESALLAGLIRSPTRLSPLNNPEGALEQRNVVLNRMRELNLITSSELYEALREPLRLSKAPQASAPQENWAMDAIRRELESVLPMGDFDAGGLTIFVTIDPELQKETESAIAKRLAETEQRAGYPHATMEEQLARGSTDYLEAAALFMDSRDGAVRSIAGGRDYSKSKFHRVLFGKRQAGSIVKPFIYAQAFTRGLRPWDRIEDARIRPGEIPRKFGRYDPANYDNEYGGPRPAEDGLVFSRNTMSVRVGLYAGLDGVARLLERAGLAENPQPFPSICLGAFETTLRDVVSAMTAFPNGGNQVHPFLIRKITDARGNVLYRRRQVRTPLLEPEAARLTAKVLEQVLTRGTGASVARAYSLPSGAAGKTGTTNQFQDAWFVGFSGNLTGGVWVGFDRPRKIASGASGAVLALPIWADVMTSPAAAPYE
jgi:penicillin-binding protein 1A